jgi:hypothetical protein
VHPVSLDKLLQAPSNNGEPVVVMLQPISPKENRCMTDKTSGRPE